MSDVIVYGVGASTYVRTVRLALEEKGVAYVHEPLVPQSDEMKALHPMGKVPAFRHGERVIAESLAISTYVDEAFDGPALKPADAGLRAVMHEWISLYIDDMYGPMGPGLVIQRLVVPARGGTPDEDMIAKATPVVRGHLVMLNETLSEQPWLAGEALSLADLYFAPMVFYFHMIPEGDTLLDGLDGVARWYGAIAGRDSFKATEPKFD